MSAAERLDRRPHAPHRAVGIRKIFELSKTLVDPVNLSIGQPDFDVPEPIKQAAHDAIDRGANAYTLTQGIPQLRARLAEIISARYDHPARDVLVTSGTSGALMLALCSVVDPGDEVIVLDPCFLSYPHLVTLAGGTTVYVDTYPDFDLDVDRIRLSLTPRTRAILLNSPNNPTGKVYSRDRIRDLAQLANKHGVLLISDEIYSRFSYDGPCPSPADFNEDVLVIDGFSKSYGMTGWRLGYAHGPQRLIQEMAKLQQFTFVCAPSMVQHAGLTALDYDTSAIVRVYQAKPRQNRRRSARALRDVVWGSILPVRGGAGRQRPEFRDHGHPQQPAARARERLQPPRYAFPSQLRGRRSHPGARYRNSESSIFSSAPRVTTWYISAHASKSSEASTGVRTITMVGAGLEEVANEVVRRARRQGYVVPREVREELARVGVADDLWKDVVALARPSLSLRNGRYYYDSPMSPRVRRERTQQQDVRRAVRELVRQHRVDVSSVERRGQDRLEFVQPVKVRAEDGREFTLLTRDLSPTGIRLVGTRRLLGQKISVLIPRSDSPEPWNFIVRILWTCSLGDDLVENGGTFVELATNLP